MKYKLINTKTKEETICDKVTIDGFDYYVSDDEIKVGDYYLTFTNKTVMGNVRRCEDSSYNFNHCKKVICTNNPNIDVPKVVDKVEMLAHKYFAEERFNWEQKNPNGLKAPQSLIKHYNKTFTPLFRAGYNKSQETHPFSKEDMIEFAQHSIRFKEIHKYVDVKELLQLWKEQKPKTMYYE